MHLAANDPPLTVLGDPTRARIVQLILGANGGRALVGRLADELGLRQPTISHHMSALHAGGIVLRQPEGRRVWYSINPEHADRIAAVLGAPTRAAEPDQLHLDRVVDDLAARFEGVFDRETVAKYVTDSHRLLSARGQTPMLTSRTAALSAARLDDLARLKRGRSAPPAVLFVCVQNAGRSQMAAGILRHLAGDRIVVRTAGSQPADEVRSSIVSALDEIGVSIGGEFPKPLTDDAVRAADYIVTMGCGDACPVYPGRRYLDWEIEDPVGKSPATVRRIRDDIDRRVRALLLEVGEATPHGTTTAS
jgi:arsenate reductase (thioredoxin)